MKDCIQVRFYCDRICFFLLLTCLCACGRGEKGSVNVKLLNNSQSTSSVISNVELINGKVRVKVFLDSLFNPTTGLLSTALNDNSLIPTSHPYVDPFFNHNGNESVTPSFFASNPEVVDWVLIEIRRNLSANSKVSSKAVFIDENGYLRDQQGSDSITFSLIEPGTYYILIRHRNHLDIISSSKIELRESSPLTLDFTSSLNSILPCQNNYDCLREVDTGVYALWRGDINQDGKIDYDNGNDDDYDYLIGSCLSGVFTNILSSVYSQCDIDSNTSVRATGPSFINDVSNLLITINAHPDNAIGNSFILEQNENI